MLCSVVRLSLTPISFPLNVTRLPSLFSVVPRPSFKTLQARNPSSTRQVRDRTVGSRATTARMVAGNPTAGSWVEIDQASLETLTIAWCRQRVVKWKSATERRRWCLSVFPFSHARPLQNPSQSFANYLRRAIAAPKRVHRSLAGILG